MLTSKHYFLLLSFSQLLALLQLLLLCPLFLDNVMIFETSVDDMLTGNYLDTVLTLCFEDPFNDFFLWQR